MQIYNELELENDKLLTSLRQLTESRDKYKKELERVLKEYDELKQDYEDKDTNKRNDVVETISPYSSELEENLKFDLALALDRIDELRLELNQVKIQRDQLKCEIERIQLELEYYQENEKQEEDVEDSMIGLKQELVAVVQEEELEEELDDDDDDDDLLIQTSNHTITQAKGFSLLDEVESEKLKLLQMNNELQGKYRKVLQLYKQSEQKCKRLRQELVLNGSSSSSSSYGNHVHEKDELVKSLQLENMKLLQELSSVRRSKNDSFSCSNPIMFTDSVQKLKRELTLAQRQRSMEMEKCHQLEILLLQQEKKYEQEFRERLRLQCMLDEERIKQKIDTLEKDIAGSGSGAGSGDKVLVVEDEVQDEVQEDENETDFNKCNQQ